MKIYVELIKPWGEYKAGKIVHFDERKGRSVIAAGKGVLVKDRKVKKAAAEIKVAEEKAKADAEAKKKPEAETATAEPNAETAEVTPTVKPKSTGNGRRSGK